MIKVSISKIEYERLKRQAKAYRLFVAKFFESIIQDPIAEVTEDFKKTGLYTKEFLEDLDAGLRKSSYMKSYENRQIKSL